MPFEGETLPLSYQLHDGATNRFCIAILKDENGDSLAGSPFDLYHIGNGKYTSDAALMPSGVKYLECTYEAYDDAGLTILSSIHTSGSDVFRFEIPDQIILDGIEEIISLIENIQARGPFLKGRILDETLRGVIDKANELKGKITREDLKGNVDDETLKGRLEDSNELNASIKDC